MFNVTLRESFKKMRIQFKKITCQNGEITEKRKLIIRIIFKNIFIQYFEL